MGKKICRIALSVVLSAAFPAAHAATLLPGQNQVLASALFPPQGSSGAFSPGLMSSNCAGMNTGAGGVIPIPGQRQPMNVSGTGILSSCSSGLNPAYNGAAWGITDTGNNSLPVSQSASARGSANFGAIRAFANINGNTAASFGGSSGKIYAGSTVAFSDHFTINAVDPAQQGTAGRMIISTHITGVLDVLSGSPTEAGFSMQPWVSGFAVPTPTFITSISGLSGVSHKLIDTTAFLGVPFIYGQSFNFAVVGLAWVVSNSSQGVNDGPVEGTSDFSHTATWNGINVVQNLAGKAIPFTLTSTTGLDWLNPITAAVPEPSETSLLLAGLGFLAVTALRRRKASAPQD
jgi:hypothetical protein